MSAKNCVMVKMRAEKMVKKIIHENHGKVFARICRNVLNQQNFEFNFKIVSTVSYS